MYPTSVEEIIASPAMQQSGGTDHSFHGMGREDIDALMLGEGRPFVLEVKNPRRRTLDLVSMARAVAAGGAVEVSELRPASPEDIRALKEDRCDKSYRIAAEMSPSIPLGKLKEGVASLEASEILQRTPARVSHRRADRVRARKIREAKVLSYDGSTAEILLRAEAGTYVKELMHGDEGRTKPSLAEILGTGVRVKELDVLRVHDEA
jgi:tRNA pseudouridine synthase 10